MVPYIFIIVVEALNVAFKEDVRKCLNRGFFFCITRPNKSFLDDTSFTVKVYEPSVGNIVEILHKFGLAFGLEINIAKSVANCSGRGTPP